MKKINKKMLIPSLIFFILAICLFIKGCNYMPYDYIDFNDNKGYSKKCYMTDDGLFCKVNNKIISVKQYGRR